MTIEYVWRGPFTDDELEPIHAEAFDRPTLADPGWRAQVEGHSLGWVTARDDATRLVGFVNVAWDGGVHAFILDAVVAATSRRRGIATELVALAERESRAAGCEWLHVDFEPHLTAFYLEACGFRMTPAGVIELQVTETAW